VSAPHMTAVHVRNERFQSSCFLTTKSMLLEAAWNDLEIRMAGEDKVGGRAKRGNDLRGAIGPLAASHRLKRAKLHPARSCRFRRIKTQHQPL
jgi:hypothetical protein